jgi:hypothetical protein
MGYSNRLKEIKTLAELYQFREDLLEDLRLNKDWFVNSINDDKLSKCQDANFYIERVNYQIRYFESKGLILTSIEEGEVSIKIEE